MLVRVYRKKSYRCFEGTYCLHLQGQTDQGWTELNKIRSSETPISIYQFIRCNTPEYLEPQHQRRENLKFHKNNLVVTEVSGLNDGCWLIPCRGKTSSTKRPKWLRPQSLLFCGSRRLFPPGVKRPGVNLTHSPPLPQRR
jgi:hypothetical protein